MTSSARTQVDASSTAVKHATAPTRKRHSSPAAAEPVTAAAAAGAAEPELTLWRKQSSDPEVSAPAISARIVDFGGGAANNCLCSSVVGLLYGSKNAVCADKLRVALLLQLLYEAPRSVDGVGLWLRKDARDCYCDRMLSDSSASSAGRVLGAVVAYRTPLSAWYVEGMAGGTVQAPLPGGTPSVQDTLDRIQLGTAAAPLHLWFNGRNHWQGVVAVDADPEARWMTQRELSVLLDQRIKDLAAAVNNDILAHAAAPDAGEASSAARHLRRACRRHWRLWPLLAGYFPDIAAAAAAGQDKRYNSSDIDEDNVRPAAARNHSPDAGRPVDETTWHIPGPPAELTRLGKRTGRSSSEAVAATAGATRQCSSRSSVSSGLAAMGAPLTASGDGGSEATKPSGIATWRTLVKNNSDLKLLYGTAVIDTTDGARNSFDKTGYVHCALRGCRSMMAGRKGTIVAHLADMHGGPDAVRSQPTVKEVLQAPVRLNEKERMARCRHLAGAALTCIGVPAHQIDLMRALWPLFQAGDGLPSDTTLLRPETGSLALETAALKKRFIGLLAGIPLALYTDAADTRYNRGCKIIHVMADSALLDHPMLLRVAVETSASCNANYYKDLLLSTMAEYNIQARNVVCVSTDNTAVMPAAVRLAKLPHAPCTVHVISLMLHSIANELGIRELFGWREFVQHSSQRRAAMRAAGLMPQHCAGKWRRGPNAPR